MFHLGVPELLVILVIALVLFGPGKLPDVGKALGKSIREFKAASSEEENKTIDVAAKSDKTEKK
jgi:sec-independent protein translocase protein TatA